MAHRNAEPDLPANRPGGRGLSRRRTPEHLAGLADSHAHLQHEGFDEDRDAVIDRAVASGIERILVPGSNLASSEAALKLAERYAPVVQAAVGIHPHHAYEMNDEGWDKLALLAGEPLNRAIGEIGIDLFRNLSPPEVQREAFARQLALAAEHGLAVLVHDRDAHAEVSAALLGWNGRDGTIVRGVLHAFSGDAAMARSLTDAGFVVSFALPLAFRSAAGPRDAAPQVPDGRYLVETDAPYLGSDHERRNEPTTTLRVVAELARLRGTDPLALIGPIRRAYDALVGPE